jgi:tetratricopeptide (TPR) repeat protein
VTFAQTNTAALVDKWEKATQDKKFHTDTASVFLLNLLARQYLYNNADSSLYFAKQALQLAEFQRYAVGEAESWNSVGQAYYVLGDYAQSLDAASNLAKISSKIKYQRGIANAYHITGLIYLGQDKNEPALSEFTKALNLFEKLNDQARVGKDYFDIGICYDESGKPEKAFEYLNKAIEIANHVKDDDLLAMTLNRKGETYFHTKNYNEALTYYTQVINLKTTSNWEMDFAYSGIAQSYYKLGKFKDAVTNAQKSFELSKQVNSLYDAIRALQILSESYAALKDYKNAYDNQVLLKRFNDGLFNTQKEKEINYLHLKEQQADNVQLKADIKNKEQLILFSRRIAFFRDIIAVATIIFIIIIIVSNRQKTVLNKTLQKQNKDIALQAAEISQQKEALDQLNHTKDQLFSVVSHDLRSPFALIIPNFF